MPIYEYKCDNCGEQTELMQKFSDPPATKCPQCGEHKLNKMVSAAAFHLKGTGWYVTDFKDKKSTPDNKKQDKPVKKDDNKKASDVKKDSPTKDSAKDDGKKT